ncbi:MAG: OmpA family protein [Myxococcota bacterium]
MIVVAFALSAAACKGKDLTAMKAQALGLVDKYKPQLQSGITTVEALLQKAKGLPAETPGIGDLVGKLTGQADNLAKLKGLLDGVPAQVDAAVKAGKEDDLKKVMTSVDADVGGGLKASDAVLADVQKNVDVLEADARIAAVKKSAAALGEKLGPPLAADTTKLDDAIAKAKALPQDAAGVADLMKALDVQKTAATAARAKLDGAVAQVDGLLANKDLAGAEKAVEAVGTEVDDLTKKLEAELTGLLAKLTELAGAAPAPVAGEVPAFDKALSTGFEVKGNGNGVEAGLIAFVDDATKVVDKTTWFNFDRLTFASGSTKLDMELSKDQLNNIVEILKAYPNLKLKIGGYTDNDGPADGNKKISQQRADAVVKALVDLGVAADRLEGEGYGPEFPVCPANDTPECKAQNRRIAVRVTAK